MLPVYNLCYRLAIYLVTILLRTTPQESYRIRNNIAKQNADSFQGTLLFAMLLANAVYRTWKMPYRVYSSNVWMLLVDWTLAFNGLYVLMSSHSVKSAFTVASSATSALSFVNTCSAIYLMIFCLRQYKNWTMWKHGMSNFDGWPTHVHMPALINHATEIVQWTETIKNAKALAERAFFMPPEYKPVQELGQHLEQLIQCNREAQISNHILSEPLFLLIQELTNLHLEAKATSVYAIPGYEEHGASFQHRVQNRNNAHSFMPKDRRKLLNQLLILPTWTGQRNIQQMDLSRPGIVRDESCASSIDESHTSITPCTTPRIELYSQSFLELLEWPSTKLYTPQDVEDWTALRWLVSIYDKETGQWITCSVISISESENLLRVKVPNRWKTSQSEALDPITAESSDYFTGYILLFGQHFIDNSTLKLVKCSQETNTFSHIQFIRIRDALESARKTIINAQELESAKAKQFLEREERAKMIHALVDDSHNLLDGAWSKKDLSTLSVFDLESNIETLANLQSKWKTVIKEWEEQFYYEHDHQPTNENKKQIRFWYEQYQTIRKLVPLLRTHLASRETILEEKVH